MSKSRSGRFKQPLHPLAEKFNASLSFDKALFAYDIKGSQAHAIMLGEQGLITTDEAEEINQALASIQQEIEAGSVVFDDHCEDIHMFIEQLLIQKIGDAGKKLHTGRSRNDQVALDLRLYTKDASLKLIGHLQYLITVLKKLSLKHAADSMPGYTHLQQAQPILLGKYFEAYQHMFERDIARFQEMTVRLNVSPLGSGALAGSLLPLNRSRVAALLGFHGVIENTLDAVSDRDFVMECCSHASITMVHLSRLCEDLILWATSEFNFVTLDDAFSTGSSLMPQKKNPDILELIRGKCGRVFGHLMGVLTIMKGLPLAYNKDMQEDKEGLFDTVNTLSACLEITAPFLESLTFNTAHMAEKVASGYLDATALVEQLVMKGMPFRDAHYQVGAWVSEALSSGSSLKILLEAVNNGFSTPV